MEMRESEGQSRNRIDGQHPDIIDVVDITHHAGAELRVQSMAL